VVNELCSFFRGILKLFKVVLIGHQRRLYLRVIKQYAVKGNGIPIMTF